MDKKPRIENKVPHL